MISILGFDTLRWFRYVPILGTTQPKPQSKDCLTKILDRFAIRVIFDSVQREKHSM